MAELTFRDGFANHDERLEVERLLWDTFHLDVSPLREMDLADPSYRAFRYVDAGRRCVANAASFTLPLIVNGRHVTAMGLQSVATRPAWRGRGLSRDLLRRALAWCDANAPLTYLMTTIPEFYETLGFRVVPQFAFVGEAPALPRRQTPGRRLDLGSTADRALLARVLRRRVPVSAHFAVAGLAGAFVLNLLDQDAMQAWFLPDHDAVAVIGAGVGGVLRLVDVAAPVMPGLGEILAGVGAAPARVEVRFPPDLLGWHGEAVAATTDTVLMLRGEPGGLERFMLPDTAGF